MKKLFSWVQPHYFNGPKEFKNYYLPYSAGILWSYSQTFQNIRDAYELGQIIWKRDGLGEAVDKLAGSDIVGFSTYIWNRNYNLELSRLYKEKNPQAFIIFGGPETPHTDSDFFTKYPWIDCVVKQEGELILKQILEYKIEDKPLDDISGIIFNRDGQRIDTGNGDRIQNLDEIPSPFLNGFFDKIISDNPDYTWSAVLEPDRGCPYQCTFCDWGSLTYSKVKKFDTQRIFDEIEWFGKNKISYMMIANANFGIFPERDNAIADKIIEVKNKYGFPKNLYVSWAKNQKKEVIKIAKKLDYLNGLGVSVQTLTSSVLDNIKRTNLEANKMEEIFSLCNEENILVHTELILGLPGETLVSWKENVWTLFKYGNHTSISFYQAQLLENSEMNLFQRRLYGLKTIAVKDFLYGFSDNEEVEERINVVIETKHMPKNDMIEALLFNHYINTFHINGITTLVARFLNKYKNIPYSEFYDRLYEALNQHPWFYEQFAETRQYYEKWMSTGEIGHPILGNSIQVGGLNLNQRMSMLIMLAGEWLAEEMSEIIRKVIGEYITESTLIEDLVSLTNNHFVKYYDIPSYPKRLNFKHDIVNYILTDAPLEREVEYEFNFRGRGVTSVDVYCVQLYTVRRGQFSKAKITTVVN